jgi:hypothetical protein
VPAGSVVIRSDFLQETPEPSKKKSRLKDVIFAGGAAECDVIVVGYYTIVKSIVEK